MERLLDNLDLNLNANYPKGNNRYNQRFFFDSINDFGYNYLHLFDFFQKISIVILNKSTVVKSLKSILPSAKLCVNLCVPLRFKNWRRLKPELTDDFFRFLQSHAPT